MTILNMKRFGAFQIDIGMDQVIAAAPVPAGGSSLQISGSVHVQTKLRVDILEKLRYSLKGYLIPIPDFDTQVTYKALWDKMVPKDDSATDSIDQDEAAGDAAPEDEPGDPDLEVIMGLSGTKLTKWFDRKRWISYASHPTGFEQNTTWFYWPAEVVNVNVNRKIFAEEPSMLMLALSSPSLDITTTSLRSTPTRQDWARMDDIDDTLNDMRKAVLDLEEVAGDAPYTTAQIMIVDLLEQAMMEEAAVGNDFRAVEWRVLSSINFKVDMPGPRPQREITAG